MRAWWWIQHKARWLWVTLVLTPVWHYAYRRDSLRSAQVQLAKAEWWMSCCPDKTDYNYKRLAKAVSKLRKEARRG